MSGSSMPGPRVPFVDENGLISAPWYRWFAAKERDASAAVAGEVTAGDGLSGGGVVSDGVTIEIATGGVENSMLRDSLAFSVIGRFQATDGQPADIVASADNRILARIGGVLAFHSLAVVPAVVADGDYGDITISGVGTVYTIDAATVTLAKMANLGTDRLIGRDTAGSGVPESLTVGGGLEFSGAGGIQTSAFTGDATKAAAGTALTLATVNANVGTFGSTTAVPVITANAKGLITALTTATIVPVTDGDKGDITVSSTGTVWTIDNDVVTYAKMQNVSATDRLLGRDTAAAGDVEELTATGGLEFTGTGIQTSAFTGDATKTAGGTALTLATVNGNVGTFGSATKASIVTVNGKGLVTAASEATVTPAWGSISGTPTTLSGYGITDAQGLDADLTTIAGLTATTDNFIVSVSSAWASRTPAQVRTTLGLVISTNVQAWSSNLDEYAAVNPTAAGLALLDDAAASDQRTTLGLGTSATVNTGTSGATLGLLSTANTWGAYQYFGVGARVDGSSSPASGEGIEFSYTGGAGAIYAYDRTGGAYKAMTYGGLTVKLQVNGTDIAAVTTTGVEPVTDNTFYLGRNDDDTPKAWKGLILKDQAGTGKYYRLEVNNNALLLVDLTD